MNEFFVSITVGFLCTLTLFAVCFLIVLGGKVVFLTVKRYLAVEQPTKVAPQRKPIRSIEIDPFEIDRIYVKKSS